MTKAEKISRYMSMLLRHRPEAAGLEMGPEGYVLLDALVQACIAYGYDIDKDTVLTLISDSEKRRFELDASGDYIRAVQGHSIPVNIEYPSLTPPQFLYHGTVDKYVASIMATGLDKRKRRHVHLSAGIERAEGVGSRRGKAVVLKVRSFDMYQAGYQFFVTPNGDWLTDSVPVKFIEHAIT